MKRTKSTKYISTLILILIHTNKHSHTSKALNRIHLIVFLSFSSTEYARRAINLCNCLTLHAISPPRMESTNSFLFIIAHCSTCTHTHTYTFCVSLLDLFALLYKFYGSHDSIHIFEWYSTQWILISHSKCYNLACNRAWYWLAVC